VRPAPLALAALLALTGCHDRAAPGPDASASVSAPPPEPDAMPSARRPTRRYYLEHTAARCEVIRVDEGGTTPPIPTPCPTDLLVGERLRIVGKTCLRESGDPARVEPVVCPDPLTNKEKRDLGLLK
jgi:hypothetical protein